MYAAKVTVQGKPGPIKVRAMDAAGPDGASLLLEDSLTLELKPGKWMLPLLCHVSRQALPVPHLMHCGYALTAGAPAILAVDGGSSLECGTRAFISQLRVLVCDVAGNATSNPSFEVGCSSCAVRSAAVPPLCRASRARSSLADTPLPPRSFAL